MLPEPETPWWLPGPDTSWWDVVLVVGMNALPAIVHWIT